MLVHDPALAAVESHRKYPAFWQVPPLPSATLMGTVGATDIENFYVVAEAWAHVVSRLAPRNASVLDVGCGCGRTARLLMLREDLVYTGFDVFRPSIEWAQRHLAPLAGGRFRFVHVDAASGHYNPRGRESPESVRFPAADSSIDLVFAASLFTHLREAHARHYLAESSRVLDRGGRLLVSIHDEVRPGERYTGDEARIDVAEEYFVDMAHAAGLAFERSLGAVCGQLALVFTR